MHTSTCKSPPQCSTKSLRSLAAPLIISKCPSARRRKYWAPSLDGRVKSRLVLSLGLPIGAAGSNPSVIPKPPYHTRTYPNVAGLRRYTVFQGWRCASQTLITHRRYDFRWDATYCWTAFQSPFAGSRISWPSSVIPLTSTFWVVSPTCAAWPKSPFSSSANRSASERLE